MLHLNNLINDKLGDTIHLRHLIHQRPELKYEETDTSALIIETLELYGITDVKVISQTGVIAIIDSGMPGKTVALRADIDALPIQEETHLPYQSQNQNIMHACGHDGHTATLLLTAYLLHTLKNEFAGKVKLIFQPAEEGGKGSTALINEGVLNHPPVDAIFAWHIWPGLSLNTIATKNETLFFGNGRFEISISGRVAHMSTPNAAINPVTIGAALITALDNLMKKNSDDAAVINIIRFECGEMKGGMTDTAKIIGVYFIENDEILSNIKSLIQSEIDKLTASTHATMSIKYYPFHNPTINTHDETELVIHTANSLFPSNLVTTLPNALTASEDFSEYLLHVPGCMYLIGAGTTHTPVHTNAFDFPDDTIRTSALMMYTLAINYLNQ